MAKRLVPEDYVGKKYSHVTVLEFTGRNKRSQIICKYVCDCGTEKTGLLNDIKSGRIQSCGCLQTQLRAEHNTTHGQSRTRLHNIWKNMRQRCNNPRHPAYKNYGGRGITVCPEWGKFTDFQEWAHNSGYEEKLTIERLDVNKGYSPDNCAWITKGDQTKNTRQNKFISLYGETKILSEWLDDDRISVNRATYYKRLESGMTEQEALMKPLRNYKRKGE